MFNSLPYELKEKIRSEYHLRLLIVVFVSIICIQIFFLIILLPSWFISLNKEKEIILQTKKTDSLSLDSEISMINSKIKSVNARLNIINSTLEYPKATFFIDSILSKKTDNIYIKELMYTSLSNNTGKIVLAGISKTRESLVSFVKELEGLKLFENVDLPISNFTKDKDINFSINMTIASQHVQ
ncbi:MAG: PilN domain-containing protein [Candidatus Paceibacterota bacterium]|jgi:Tfp pilus assembly protein PilN